jgi:hypothetical protein
MTVIDLTEERMPTAQELAGFVISAEDIRKVNLKKKKPKYGYESETEDSRALNDVGRAGASGGRASVESQADIRWNTQITEFMQIGADEDTRDIFEYSERMIRNMRQPKLLEMLSNASPEMSRALFDFLIMCCPGWELDAVDVKDPENGEQIPQGQDYLQECMNRLKVLYKAPEVIFVKYFMSAFLRGGLASEVVLDKRGREFVDLCPIDPDSLESHRINDPVRGMIWKIYQRQFGQLVDLNIPTVAYVPIHSFFRTNRGRPLARPAIFVCFFLIATLQDLRRVIRQQGYPRVDIAVNIDKLRNMVPQAQQKDMKALKSMADQIVAEVQDIYCKLKPDDTFVHTEVVTVNQPVGTMNASSLGVVDGLLKMLERMATRALKTMPLLMATTDGVSEANANRQWEIYAAGIKSIQHYTESILEDHFDVALQAKGIQAKAKFRFSELRASELLRDAQVKALETETARTQYDNGSISADEMAKLSAGKDKADVPEPRAAAAKIGIQGNSPGAVAAADAQPEPGANRKMIIDELMRMTAEDVVNADKLFDEYAPTAFKGLLNAKDFQN